MPKLCVMYPKTDEIGEGEFTFQSGQALFVTPEGMVYKLERAQVIVITCHITKISGFEQEGYDRSGRGKYFYQEWAVRP